MILLSQLEDELGRLCSFYKVSEEEKPLVEFEPLKDAYGWYDPDLNVIYIDENLYDEAKAIRTLRHEFGHFIKHHYRPHALYHNGEEVVARTLEGNPYAFQPPKHGYQTRLTRFNGKARLKNDFV